MRISFLHTTLALLVAGPAVGQSPPDALAKCERFSTPFFFIAKNKDAGLSRDQQTDLLYSEAGTRDPEQLDVPARYTLSAINFVYQYPDKTADEIKAIVLARCTVSEDGRVSMGPSN